MISQKTINEIFSTARVEEVIGDFIQLKKSGSNYKGLSPFSNEKTPSFMVSPAKQIWKDFSSGKGGSVVSFLMEHEQFTYPEALRWLAKRYNIAIEEEQEKTDEQLAKEKEKETQYTLTNFAATFFKNQLKTEEGKQIGLTYLKERGFSKETIEKFDLGYSPKSWNAFSRYAMEKGYSYKLLEATGLSVGSEENPVDRFRERVIFPIHSFSGRVLGFGGRVLKTNIKTAKYLNSPENEIYHKSKILYGIYQAKQSILKQDSCVLVEGYTDVISLHQAGIENVVASSGTSLTPEQIRLIKRLTNNIILIYDGDSAGIKASFRGIDLILRQELNVKVIVLPEGEDPDSFARKYSDTEIQTFITENATDFIRFKTTILSHEAGNDPVKKSEMISEIIASIALIPNIIQQELYVKETARLLQIREEVLFKQLAVEKIKHRKSEKKKASISQENSLKEVHKKGAFLNNPFMRLEEEIVQAVIKYGTMVCDFPHPEEKDKFYRNTVIEEIDNLLSEDQIEFTTHFYKNLYQQIKENYQQTQQINPQQIMQQSNEKVSEVIVDFLFEKYEISDWKKKGTIVPRKEDNTEKYVRDLVLNYKRLKLLEMVIGIKDELRENPPQERVDTLKEQYVRVKKVLSKLEKILGRVV